MERDSALLQWVVLVITLNSGCAFVSQNSEPDENGNNTPQQRTYMNPCGQGDNNAEATVEQAQQQLLSLSCETALWLDGLGGKSGDADAARRTHGYIETSVEYSEFEGFSSDTKFRVDSELPVLKNRLRVFAGRERDESYTQQRSETFALKSEFQNNAESGSWLAGLGYSVPGLERFETDVSAGLSGIPDVKLYINSQSRLTVLSTPEKLLHLSVKPFWTNKSGFGITADEDFSVILKEGILLRLLQVNTISERSLGLNWYGVVILYQKLNYERGLAWQIFSRGQTDAPEPLTNYGAQVSFRTPVIRNRLNGEFKLGLGFPRNDPTKERKSSGNISLNFILPFGKDHTSRLD